MLEAVYIIYIYTHMYIYANIDTIETFMYAFLDHYNLPQTLTLDIKPHLSRKEACYPYICSHSSVPQTQAIHCSQIV